MPKATALLPAYQAAKFIQPTLDSLSAQTFGDFSVIVSVDACSDETRAICEAHAKCDPRFSVLQQNQRQGYVGNCNFLLDQADAEYVCLAFHDDILYPTFIAELSATLDAHPEAVMAYPDMWLTDETNGRETAVSYDSLAGLKTPVERGRRMLKGPRMNWWVPNRGLFRLARARRIGGLVTPGAAGYAPDFPWLLHMCLLGEFVRVPRVLCHKTYKTSSLSKGWQHSAVQMHAAAHAGWCQIWKSELSLADKFKLGAGTWRVPAARARDLLLRRR